MPPNLLDLHTATMPMTVQGQSIEVAYLRRIGSLAPLVCLHGFGSTKEDYADMSLYPGFSGHDLLMIDAPGFGTSTIAEARSLSISLLVDVAVATCDALGLSRFHLSGHSMGGLTALMLAHAHSERVLSFIDIEGNVAPEDCFLSRQIVDHPAETPDAFLQGFVERVSERPEYGSRLYSSSLAAKVAATSVQPIFESMVRLSDEVPLMEMLAGLGMPRLFIYGEQNRHLSYLQNLPDIGVEVAEIPFAGHFPMYSNPPALWATMAEFLARCEVAK